MTYYFPIAPGSPEVTYYGPCEGGHVAQVIAAENIGAPAALALVQRESNLTGWEFTTDGQENEAKQFVWIARRKDGRRG